MSEPNEVAGIVERCQALFDDLRFGAVQQWKAAVPGRKAIGYMPIYVPDRRDAARGRVTRTSLRECAACYQETTMALFINDGCTACDACRPVCPNEAISVGDPVYVIDAMKCTECVGAEDEPQCRLVCPADCIDDHPDYRESRDELLAKYHALHA